MRRVGVPGTRFGAVVLAAAIVGGPLFAAGCGGDGDDGNDRSGLSSSDASATGGAGGSDDEVTVPEDVVAIDGDPADVTALDNTFDAKAISVAAGTTVRWTNRGRQDHDIAPAEGDAWGIDAGDFGPGQSYQHTFDEPGTYSYYCTIHGTATRGMVGVVVVE